jgi:hypothetical protein
MTYKPPEKDLTPDEAISLAKKELAPFWFNISPQIAAVREANRSIVFPLNPAFSKQPWLIFLADPTELSTGAASVFLKEWAQRYSVHQLGILVILYPTYSYLIERRESIQDHLEKYHLTFPVVLDHTSGLSQAFDCKQFPKVLLIHKNKRYFDYSGQSSFSKIELDIQTFLRSSDPGLPLLPIFYPNTELLEDSVRIELGAQPRLGASAVFPENPNPTMENGIQKVQFIGFRPKQLEVGQVILSGLWTRDSEKMMTSDSSAHLEFLTAGSTVSLIAQIYQSAKEVPRILVELDGVPVTEVNVGEHLTLDEVGQALVSFKKPKLYHILSRLSQGQHSVTLRFINAEFAPVALYGIRFANVK